MAFRKQFILSWLRNMVLSTGLIIVLAYILLMPQAFPCWWDKLAAFLLTGVCYSLSRYVLLPNVFRWSRYKPALLLTWIISVVALFTGLLFLISRYTGAFIFRQGEWDMVTLWTVLLLMLLGIMFAFFMYSWQFAVNKWKAYYSLQRKLDRSAVAAEKWELVSIAKDLDPHFIANSMATIRTLIRESSEQALLAVGIFGRIATFYMQMDARPWISLEFEMQMINKLVKLYQCIKQQQIFIHYDNGVDASCPIPKMLLFNLVENALQYGETGMQEHPIRIQIMLENLQLVKLEVSNRIADQAVAGKMRHQTSLDRIARQLMLLDPEHAKLIVRKQELCYTVAVWFSRQISES